MLKTTFKLTELELRKGLVAISRSRFIMKAFRVIGIILVIVFLSILYSDITHRLPPTFYSIAVLVFGLYMIFMPEISCSYQASNLIKTGAPITEKTNCVFDETSYQYIGESYSSRLAYDKLYDIKETEDFILLRVTGGSAHILPKRALSIEQLNTFKQIVASVPELKLKLN